ncbi:hypothetical protein [Mucilaginibacter jinjuensis]|uniref:Uncharacterized protein n=1 Tax=Mucilaginibacter jinjuensis TaxID=1176721 RepID=A0ABY7TDK4_9SPHI|nr:hypothetical protein [Mucilaginibacter jinjuensis]WCT14411.1 hypothetical protein PQO05_10755 [Mucilaginibacter jinjuensis]
MQQLSNDQIQKIQTGTSSRDGFMIPGTDQGLLNNAACWAWALQGNFQNVNDDLSVQHIYYNLFLYDSQQAPTAINDTLANNIIDIINHEDVASSIKMLNGFFGNANAGNTGAQADFRSQLMHLTAMVYGYTVSAYEADKSPYAIHMKTKSWYGWDHWAISVLMPNGTRNYLQTVSGSVANPRGIHYNCNCVWDESLPETVIGIEGLQPGHLNVIDKIVLP